MDRKGRPPEARKPVPLVASLEPTPEEARPVEAEGWIAVDEETSASRPDAPRGTT